MFTATLFDQNGPSNAISRIELIVGCQFLNRLRGHGQSLLAGQAVQVALLDC